MIDKSDTQARTIKWLTIVTPLWLVACLLLGGASAGGTLVNAILQLAAACIIALAIGFGHQPALRRNEGALLCIAGITCGWIVLTLVPLPAALWTALPGRSPVAEGYRLLDVGLPWMSMSLADTRTIRSGLWLLVPIAMFLMVRRLPRRGQDWLLGSLLVVTVSSIVLGLAQQVGGTASPLRFYSVTNPDSPVGFFANVNHFGTLLVVSVPLCAAWLNRWWHTPGTSRVLPGAAFGLLVCVVALGLAVAKSVAGLGLLVPAILGGLAILLNFPRRRSRRPVLILAVVSGAVTLASFVVLNNNTLSGKFADAPTSRAVATPMTLEAALDYMPVGSGLGTFSQVFAAHQPDRYVSAAWMNHAHNDIAEVLLELGLVGALAMIAFAFWLVRLAWRQWMVGDEPGTPIARAATLALLLIGLHSVVDYPLRTAAIAALAATLLALALVQGEGTVRTVTSGKGD